MDAEISFDAREMIDAFDMDEFLKEDEEKENNGAFLLITDGQCVLSYTGSLGKGYHYEAVGNALCEIYGEDKTMEAIPYLYGESDSNNIMARLINEQGIVYIMFDLSHLKSITPNQLKLFEMFMEEYNDYFGAFSLKIEEPFVLYDIDGEESSSDDLTEVYEYLKSIVDEKKKVRKDKNIIGKIVLDSGFVR